MSSDTASNGFPLHQDRYHLPEPEWTFPNARINTYEADSVADFPPMKQAPEGAPNILLVLVDDLGFGWPSVNGGLVRMPNAERVHGKGLFYNQFHTTALCAPTRAALLTGRNHHSVASGNIAEMATGYPGYCGIIPKSTATMAELLKSAGYTSGWWGKNHNVPDNQTSPAGPFDNWPTGRGFDYFYGFISGETDQFYPSLYRGTTAVEAPKRPDEGYHLTTDLADDLIGWLREQKTIAPDRPVFTYFSTGCAHAPHQPPLDWRGRNAGRFDMGWDAYREQVHANQLRMGIIPEGTALTERPEQIPSWDSQPEEHQRLFARQAENYADFVEHCDHEVGRVLDAYEALGELDNTIVIYILGDNGSSGEGSLIGTPNEVMSLNGQQVTIDEAMQFYETWGMPGTSPHYSAAWAHAGDTPFQWTKQIASHFGGTRNSMVMSWPERIKSQGEVRSQFSHVIDVLPTILEVVGIREPVEVDGVGQRPIEGTSLAYTFADADAPGRHETQYFEMYGNRAMYHDGWMASCRHGRLPWETAGTFPWEGDTWELYNIREDFSQSVDLAEQEPERLQALKSMFDADAARYNVLPLDDRFAERLDVTLRPSYYYGRKKVTLYPGMVRQPEGSGPKFIGVPMTITAPITVPEGGAEGVVFALGGDAAGFAVFLWEGKVCYHYNYFGIERYDATAAEALSPGEHTVVVEFAPEAPAPGAPAEVTVLVDGEEVARTRVARQIPLRAGTETFDVGMDSRSPVCNDYEHRGLFEFTGAIESVTFDFGDSAEPTGMDRLELAAKMD